MKTIAMVALSVVWLAACESPVATTPVDPPSFAVTPRLGVDLGSLGGQGRAHDVNNGGEVVGFSALASGASRAFLWTAEQGMVDLGINGAASIQALAINDLGQVAGVRGGVGAGSNLGFFWSDGVTTLIPSFEGEDLSISSPQDLNNTGKVVGFSRGLDLRFHAFVWTKTGGLKDLGTLGGNAFAEGINDAGQIVGSSNLPSGTRHAFLWENGVMSDLGTLGGNVSVAFDINNDGVVLGESQTETSGGQKVPFLWTAEDGMQPIPLLPGMVFDAQAINDAAHVVGTIHVEQTVNTLMAVIWTPSDGFVRLPTSGFQGGRALGLNDVGLVVGLGFVRQERNMVPMLWEVTVVNP